MMNTPSFHPSFEKVKTHLQITFTPEQQRQLEKKHLVERRRHIFQDEEIDTYWHQLPNYIIARCPLCGATFTSPVDTHGIWHWIFPSDHFQVFTEDHQDVGCSHFVGVQVNLNLNGFLPTELTWLHNQIGDIPVITPELFPEDMESYAVMHSLPICRLIEDEFVPRYSVYMLTYYATDGKALEQRRIKAIPANVHWGTILSYSGRARLEPIVADLKYWVGQGKLLWLDLDDPALPLISGPADQFPYTGITGYGGGYLYRKRPKPRWPWQQRKWSPDGEIKLDP